MTDPDGNLNANAIIETNNARPGEILHRLVSVLDFMGYAISLDDALSSDNAKAGAYFIFRSCENAAKHVEAMLDAEDAKHASVHPEEVNA